MMSTIIQSKIENLASQNEFKNQPFFYLYDWQHVEQRLKQIQDCKPSNLKLYYSMKANSNPDLLERIARSDSIEGLEIASKGELAKALQATSASHIMYTGPAKTESELEESIQAGIRFINVESYLEAQRINQIAARIKQKVDILIRINTNFYLDGAIENMNGVSTKLGIDEGQIGAIGKKILELPHVNVKGIHVHNATGILNVQKYISFVKYIFNLVNALEKNLSIRLSAIDLGGGLGIDYREELADFDFPVFAKQLQHLIDEVGFQDREIIIEPGTFLVGKAGYYVSEIIDIKDSKGSKHIVCSGGVNHLRLPSASGINQPVHIVRRNCTPAFDEILSINNETVDVCGPLCFQEDRLAKGVKVDNAAVGDLVVISHAGAYGYSVASLELLSHAYPREYLFESGK